MSSYREYGEFDESHKEFVIRRPDTPRPWINYLSNGAYCTLISQTGGGYSFYRDSSENRITRWAPANYLNDRPGRYIYVRDAESGEVFGGTYAPVNKSERYECRHGLGYTQIKNRYSGIQVKTTFFVPEGERLEVWRVEVKNTSRRRRKVQVFPFIEWLLGGWDAELGARNLTVLMNEGRFDDNLQAVWCGKFPWGNKPWPYHAFMASSLPVEKYDIDYEAFVGADGRYDAPRALVREGECTNSVVRGNNMVGVLQHTLEIDPSETASFQVMLGIAENEHEAAGRLEHFRDDARSLDALKRVKRKWRRLIDTVEIETPDAELNSFFNVWLKYQVAMNNHWGRSATYYHEGHGEFGYRNTAQDAWGFLPLDARFAKEKMLELARHQRNTGQPMAGWSLVTGTNEGKAPADFPIWLPLLVSAYVKETGDFNMLEKNVPYYDGGSDTLYQHVRKAMRFLQDRAKSDRGLPLMGTQDWNDAFDRTGIGGKGESVWLGMGLCVGLDLLKDLASFMGDHATVDECETRHAAMKELINHYGWVGDRYVYAYNDKGEPIGSPVNEEGSCQLNAQTWAILAGLPDKEQREHVLNHIDHTLDTPFGPALFTEPYTTYNGDIGRITAFAPGTKENAAVFTHGGAFKIVMDYMIGRSDDAYRTIKQVLPNAASKDIDVYRAEPYVFPEYVVGPGNPRYGEGAFTWLTGSADWVFIAIAQYMMGAIPTFEGLKIDPSLPSGWKQARLLRKFRGTRYDIRISNPEGVNKGVLEIKVDGAVLDGDVLPAFRDRIAHIVEVRMGASGNEALTKERVGNESVV